MVLIFGLPSRIAADHGKRFIEFENKVAATDADLMRIMYDLPTRYVTNVMHSARHRQTEQKWEPNDFIDVVALPVAAVYCDVVVERQWVHRLRQGKVNQRYDTVILSNTADLVNLLATEDCSPAGC